MKWVTIWATAKKIVWAACILFAVFLCVVIIELVKISLMPYHVTSERVTVQQTRMDNNNAHQNNAEVNIFSINRTLYFFIKSWPDALGLRSKFSGKLCTIENGRINVLQEASLVYGNDNRFIYLKSNNQLIAYDTQSGIVSTLTQLTEYKRYDAVPQSDGALKFFINDENMECFSVKNGKIHESEAIPAAPVEYILGEKRYSVTKNDVYCQGENISDQFGKASFRAIVPYQEGLLLINDGYGNLLYYIQENGEILDVFPEFECFCSESSINYYEHYIFVSFLRWEGWDESGLGIKRFEDDRLAGTYRIDTRDFSVEKISDNIYSGMYIFDDSGIYTCSRSGDVSKISFCGEELQMIVD